MAMTHSKRKLLGVALAGLGIGMLVRHASTEKAWPEEAATAPASVLINSTRGKSIPARLQLLVDPKLSSSQQLRMLAGWKRPVSEEACWNTLLALDSPHLVDTSDRVLNMLATPAIDQLVRLDPSKNFLKLWQSEDLNHREAYLGEFLRIWTKIDPPAAKETLASLSAKGNLKQRLAEAVVDTLIPLDPIEAVKLIGDYQLPNRAEDFLTSTSTNVRLTNAFGALAKQDPALAAEEALRLGDEHQRRLALEPVMKHWAEKDLTAALSFLEGTVTLSESYHLSPLWRSLARGLAKIDPLEALRLTETRVPERYRRAARDTIAESWATTAPAEAAQHFLTSPNEDSIPVHKIAQAWAKNAPDEALEWAASLEHPPHREVAFSGITQALASTNPEKAFFACVESGIPHLSDGLIAQSAYHDWKGTLETVSAWEDSEFRSRAAMSLFEHAYVSSTPLGTDADHLLDWIAEEHESIRHFSHLGWVLTDPQLERLSKNHPELYQKALPSIINERSSVDPASAASLVANLDDETNRTKALEQLVPSWAAIAPVATSEWLTEQPLNDSTIAGHEALAKIWTSFDQESATTWAHSLPESPQQNAAIRGLK